MSTSRPRYARLVNGDESSSSTLKTACFWVAVVLLASVAIVGLVVASVALARVNEGPAPTTAPAPPAPTTAPAPTPTVPPSIALGGGTEIIRFTGPTIQHMTVPVDLSSVVGTTYSVCNVNGLENTITRPAPTDNDIDVRPWVADTYYTVLRFSAGDTCCVTYTVVTASAVQLTNNPCASACQDTSAYMCIPSTETIPLSPFTLTSFAGWWVARTPSKFEALQGISYLNIVPVPNSTGYFNMFQYRGTAHAPREINNADCSPFFEFVGVCSQTSVLNTLYYQATPTSIHNVHYAFPDLTDYLDVYGNGPDQYQRFQMDPMGKSMVLADNRADYPTDTYQFSVWDRIAENKVPTIIPRSTGTISTTSPYHPESIMRAYADLMLNGANPANIAQLKDDDFLGVQKAIHLLDTIITQGVSFETPIVAVRRTIPAPVIKNRATWKALTEFQTSAYNHAISPARVRATGFTGAWSVLNNVQNIVAPGYSSGSPYNGAHSDFAAYPSASSQKYRISVYYNSTTLTGAMSGSPKLRVSYGPITAATEYLELIAAINYWAITVYGDSDVVTPANVYIDTSATEKVNNAADGWYHYEGLPTLLETFAQVKTAMHSESNPFYMGISFQNMVTASEHTANIYNGIGKTMASAEAFTPNDQLRSSFSEMIRPDRHSPFHVNPLINNDVSHGLFSYNIGRDNYLDLSTLKTLGWTVTGNSNPAPVDTNFNVADTYWWTGGAFDEYDFEVTAYNTFYSFTSPYRRFPYGSYYPYPEAAASKINLAIQDDQMYFGRINPAYTGGRNIGYIRLAHFMLWDAAGVGEGLGAMSFSDLCPSEYKNTTLRPYGNHLKMWSKVTTYLKQTLACDDVIIDIRGHANGKHDNWFRQRIVTHALRSMFGTETQFVRSLTTVVNKAKKTTEDLPSNHPWDGNSYTVGQYNEYVHPDVVEAIAPGSTISGVNVMILQDSLSAGASGKVLPNLFLGKPTPGNGWSKDLGGNTPVKFFGTSQNTRYRADSFADQSAWAPPVSNDNPEGFTQVSLGICCASDYTYCNLFPFPCEDGPLPNTILPASQTAASLFGYTVASAERLIALRADGSFFGERIPQLASDCTALHGLSGGCSMPSSWDALVYPDLGLVANTRARLTGDTRPQTPVTIVTTGGIISTVNATSVITFTTPSAHGFFNGDIIGVQLLDPSVTNVGGIDMAVISYLRFSIESVTSNTFAVDLAAAYDGPSNANIATPPQIDANSIIATSTVSGAGGALRLYKVNHWRDAWLEATIAWSVAHPVTAKRSVQSASLKKSIPAAPMAHARTVRDVYKRDTIACPTNVTLTPLADVVPTVNLTIYALSGVSDDAIEKQLDIQSRAHGTIMREQFASGGFCLNAADGNRIYATPSLTAYGKLVWKKSFPEPGPAKKK